ncbi:MAG TPA: tripartite tricarboxylate transporter substrate binding protein [Burkholderiales bacterium]|nr:tripartite tricarboxylate transporter substrate binding protein [Burkholderiales bacterium]
MTLKWIPDPFGCRRSGMTILCSAILGASAAIAAQGNDSAATYPQRPVRFVIGFTPGGQPDLTARLLAVKLTESLGQQVVIENRPGAGGTIGTKIVAEATPDGHTLLSVSSSYVITPSIYAKLPYDPKRDLAGITTTASAPYVLVVSNALGVKTVQDLVAAAKAKPGQLNFASAGVGSGLHLAAEVFVAAAQIQAAHIPYKGVGEALTDTIAGRTQFVVTPPPTLGTVVKDGKLRALAVTGKQRSATYPDVPTMSESGFPGYEWYAWAGMLAPSRTPRAIVEKLNRHIHAALAMADIRQRYAAMGSEPAPRSPEEFDRMIASEMARIAAIARKAGIRAE